MPKLLKFILLALCIAGTVIVGYQMFDYWISLSYFPFVPTVFVGTVHLIILILLGKAIVLVSKIKA